MSQGSPEEQKQKCVDVEKEIYFKALAHRVMGTGKSKIWKVSQQAAEVGRAGATVETQRPSAG